MEQAPLTLTDLLWLAVSGLFTALVVLVQRLTGWFLPLWSRDPASNAISLYVVTTVICYGNWVDRHPHPTTWQAVLFMFYAFIVVPLSLFLWYQLLVFIAGKIVSHLP